MKPLLDVGARRTVLSPMAPLCPRCALAGGRRAGGFSIRCHFCGHQWESTKRERGDVAIDIRRREQLGRRRSRDLTGRFALPSTVLANYEAP